MELTREEIIKRIAFAGIKKLNRTTAESLLERVGSIDRYFSLPTNTLSALTTLDSKLISEEYRNKLLEAATVEADFVSNKSIDLRFFADKGYPGRLQECEDAPALLFSTGTCNLDSKKSIAVVGTRHATAYGVNFVRQLIGDLSKRVDDMIVVSGLAYGIDVAAHKAALEYGVPTVAVLAHGLNTIYPADHRSVAAEMVRHGGAIVTEYNSTDTVHRGNFLARNRIVAGLADAVIVVESDVRGGAMSTARIASAYNREVMAVPGRISDAYSRGCNELIANRTASIIRDADDLCELMNWPVKDTEDTQKTFVFEMSDSHKRIARYITEHPGESVNDLCIGLGMPFRTLSSELFEMEMKDIIVTLPGGRYAVIAPIE